MKSEISISLTKSQVKVADGWLGMSDKFDIL